MSNGISTEDAVARLSAEADAVGRLAQDTGGFAATVAAFAAKNPDAFRWVLQRLELLPRCELICEWVRIKIGVLRCIEVCGIPAAGAAVPDFAHFVRAVARLAENERLLRRIVDAVSCGDGDDYRAAVAELGLGEFCHLICHWVYSIVYRRVCEIVCSGERLPLADPAAEVRAAARVAAEVAANQTALGAIGRAAVTLDCGILRTELGRAGFSGRCEIICELICAWRCGWVCHELCVLPPAVLTGAYAIEEARSFALAARGLANQPRALGELVSAVQQRDPRIFAEIVARFGLGPYCRQVCAWVCGIVCREFCICVCGNPALQPWFTTVGYFDIYADIDAATGKTNKSLPYASLDFHGGPHFAFYDCLQLGGFCPATSPVFSGVAMKYRFLYDAGSGALPITGSLLCPVEAGTRIINWPQNLGGIAGAALVPTFQPVTIQAAPLPPDPIPPAPGTTWIGPSAHYIAPDADGWVAVDPNAVGGGFQVLLGFDTTKVVAGGPPLAGAIGTPGGVPAGSAVPAAGQGAGSDLSITFEATRVTVATVDFSNGLSKIHINNWTEVNNLWFLEFGSDCCTGIDASLSVQFTADHEEMDAGAWSLAIGGCSPSAPGDITPHASGPGVTVTPRGGWGTIVENTSGWALCSYTVGLATRPGLTTGLRDRLATSNTLTFCICGHG